MPDFAKPLREWNKRMEAKLAKRNAPLMDIKERMARTIQEYYGDKLEYPLVDKILDLPVSEEGKCQYPDHDGMKKCHFQGCPKCNGTGIIPPKTLKQLIEEARK